MKVFALEIKAMPEKSVFFGAEYSTIMKHFFEAIFWQMKGFHNALCHYKSPATLSSVKIESIIILIVVHKPTLTYHNKAL